MLPSEAVFAAGLPRRLACGLRAEKVVVRAVDAIDIVYATIEGTVRSLRG
jgi:hypothetical protein